MFNFSQLQCFSVVADESSFTVAAERLHLTQPAISKRILNLEQAFGVALFERDSRKVVLTSAGETLLPFAHRILNEIRAAEDALTQASNEVTGTLRLATSHHIGLHRLPPLLREYTEQYSGVRIELKFIESEAAKLTISRDDADIALVTLTDEAMPTGITKQALWNDPMTFCCGTKHPLAERSISLKELEKYQAILPARTTETFKRVSRVFSDEELVLDALLPTNDLEAIKMMVQIGMGWTVLPQTMFDASLREIRVRGARVTRTLGAVYANRKRNSRPVLKLVELLTSGRQK